MAIQTADSQKRIVGHSRWTTVLKRVRSAVGFTLTEVLATVIVVGLVSAGLATAVTVGSQQFSRSMAMSESKVLYSIIEQDLKNDLSYTTRIIGVAEEDNSDVYDVEGYASLHHGDKSQLLYLRTLSTDGKQIAEPVTLTSGDKTLTGIGQLALCSSNNIRVRNRLISSKAYNYGLKACIKSLTYDKQEKRYSVSLAIATGDNLLADVLVDRTFTIEALNNTAILPTSTAS